MGKKIDLSQFAPELKKALESVLEEITAPSHMKQIGDNLAEQLRIRTRLGNGLNQNGGEPSKLKPLSTGYIEERKKIPLSSLTTPKKSNLTQTGQMLDDLVAIPNSTPGKTTLTFKEQSSKDKARWNADSGRPFLAISRVQIQRLQNELRTKISNLLKKYF